MYGMLRQNGYIVRDIRTSMTHWATVLGVGPWFYIERIEFDWFRYRGAPSAPHISIALANSGDLQIELIQQRNDAPSLYRDFLIDGGEGLQHLCFWPGAYQSAYDATLASGQTVGHEGQIGGPAGRFAFFEAPGAPRGTMVELLEMDDSKRRVFEHIRRAAGDWDGSDPIRSLG